MKVTDPSGQTWRVTRRWVPWRLRRREMDPLDGADVASDFGDDLIIGLVLFAVVLVVALLFPWVFVALFAMVELLLLLVLLPIAVVGRVVFGRHWHVELRRGFRPWWEVEAGDWQASKLKIHEVADDVRQGEIPPRTLGFRAPDEVTD
ncbi:hypothetical protein [Nocardia salmonicida]|uniref:hypothetical protein n=1 Tax=Nocardia salmonicida TaxID=53431 RepID=UPI00340F1F49